MNNKLSLEELKLINLDKQLSNMSTIGYFRDKHGMKLTTSYVKGDLFEAIFTNKYGREYKIRTYNDIIVLVEY